MVNTIPSGYEAAMARWYPYQGNWNGLPVMLATLAEVVQWCKDHNVSAKDANIFHIKSSSQKVAIDYTPLMHNSSCSAQASSSRFFMVTRNETLTRTIFVSAESEEEALTIASEHFDKTPLSKCECTDSDTDLQMVSKDEALKHSEMLIGFYR